jgi:hypothetical protein
MLLSIPPGRVEALQEGCPSERSLGDAMKRDWNRYHSVKMPYIGRVRSDGRRAVAGEMPCYAPGMGDDRWSLRLELRDEEIAKLYAQGLTRGALVWRDGMPEWQPLLVAPELSSLLLHTRITLTDVNDAALVDEVTLPRPARVPSQLAFEAPGDGADRRDVPTVAPTALDVATSTAPRRRGDLLAVAVLGFALAWFVRGRSEALPQSPAAAAAPVPVAAAPAPPPSGAPAAGSRDSGSSIPIVAIADLPLLGATRASEQAPLSTREQRASAPRAGVARANGGGAAPTRQELSAALNQVAGVASGCGERDAPVRVVISFANSGVARSIQVSCKDLPSRIRSCIIGAASRARIASFSGDPVTVSKTL